MKRKITLTKLSTLLMLFIFTFGILISNSVCKAAEVNNNSIPDDCIYTVGTHCQSGDVIFEEENEVYGDVETIYYQLKNLNGLEWLKKTDIEFINTSNSNILKFDKSASGLKLVRANSPGVAYLDINIKETENYKPFKIRYYVFVDIPDSCGMYFSQLIDKNKKGKEIDGFYFPVLKKNTLSIESNPGPHFGAEFSGDTKINIEISSDKGFKNKIKKYKTNGKKLKKSIKNLKKIGVKKNKKFYIRAYAYKNIGNNITLYTKKCEAQALKIKKNGDLKKVGKSYESKLNKKVYSINEVFSNFGLDTTLTSRIDTEKLDRFYKK